MLPVCLGGVFFASWKVRKDECWIRFPARTSSGVFSTCHGVGSEAVLVLAWSDLLDLFADGASDVFVAVRFLVAAVGC